MSGGNGDVEKVRFWQGMIREAARSGMSIPEFRRRHRLKESRFYWWQDKLKASRQHRIRRGGVNSDGVSFALVSDEQGMIGAGIELGRATGLERNARRPAG
jgi:hypothetical protein